MTGHIVMVLGAVHIGVAFIGMFVYDVLNRTTLVP